MSQSTPLFVFNFSREKSVPISEFVKRLAKMMLNGEHHAKIKSNLPRLSLQRGENVGRIYQTWNFGMTFFPEKTGRKSMGTVMLLIK